VYVPGVRWVALAVSLGVACGGASDATPRAAAPPAPEPVRARDYGADVAALAAPIVDGEWIVGASIALVHDGVVEYHGVGRAAAGGDRAPDADTIYEIGSVTKVFTALLLADAVARLEVELDDPVGKHLPAGTAVPERDGTAITLEHLATHASGLPRMPTNFSPADVANPFADYTVDDLYAFLRGHLLTVTPGALYDYSNVGAGLLGHALARAAGTSFEALVVERIAAPLGMTRTSIAVAGGEPNRARGHDVEAKPVPDWDIPTLAGAGALRSTARDMASFVRANLALDHRELGPAMRTTQEPRRETVGIAGHIGLGWHIKPGGTWYWHNGQTGGHHSYVAFDRERKLGVVLLANTGTMLGDVLGEALMLMLRGEAYRIELPPTLRPAEEELERFVGSYQMSPTFVLSIRREGDRLIAQGTDWPSLRLFASSQTEFYLRVLDARIAFEVGADGRATGLVLHEGENTFRGKRL
jgi:CubicO group peptidase (beta-lactamase class C family)